MEILVFDDAKGCSDEVSFPTMQETASVEMLVFGDVKGCSFEDFGFRRRGRGALRSPTPPRGTGCERVATLSRSPGAALAGSLVSDDAGVVLLTAFVSDNAGVVFLTTFVSDNAGLFF